MQTLLGRVVVEEFPKAQLCGYSRHPVKNFVFPGMIPSQQSKIVNGYLLKNLDSVEMKLMDWFEGDEYERRLVKVSTLKNDDSNTKNAIIDAYAYIWKPHLLGELILEAEWCYDTFCTDHLDWYMENTVRPCRAEMESLSMTQWRVLSRKRKV